MSTKTSGNYGPDLGFQRVASLNFYWGHLPCVAMPPLRVVEHLEVIEDTGPGLLPAGIDATPDLLPFEQLEEALGQCYKVA